MKKPLFKFKNNHRKKVSIIAIGILVVLWNFTIVPVAAMNGLNLPSVTIEHLQTLSTFLLGF